MTDYINLLGSDDVLTAGRNISSAADKMQRAALQIDTSLSMFTQYLETFITRLECMMDENREDK